MKDNPTLWGFLHDIQENPGDDTPRLILADWLEDHDPDNLWPVLIRHQIAYYNLADRRCVMQSGQSSPHLFLCEGRDWTRGKNARRCEPCRLSAECMRVLDHWLYHPPGLIPYMKRPSGPENLYWERGFIHSVEQIDLDFWRQHGPELVRWHPIDSVRLLNPPILQTSSEYWGTVIYQDCPSWFAEFYRANTPPLRKTADEAEEYLSQLLLAWARQQVDSTESSV